MAVVAVNSLGRFKRQRKVVGLVFGFELRVIEGVRVEVVDQSAKGQAVVPARAKVLDLHVLHWW